MAALDQEFKSMAQEATKRAEPLKEVKLLLEGDSAKDMHILRNMAGNSRLAQAEEALGRRIDLEEKNMKYGETYTINQIELLARKYKLRFVGSHDFAGDLPVDCIAKVKEFANKAGEPCLDEISLRTRFFVLAPAETFTFALNPISRTDMRREAKEEERARRLAELDPVLFYKIDDVHYRLIHKWGNDFGLIRRAKGFMYDNIKNYLMIMRVLAVMLFLVLAQWPEYLRTQTDWTKWPNLNGSLCIILAYLLMAGITTVLYYMVKIDVMKENMDMQGNSKLLPQESVFSVTNWDKTWYTKR